MNKPASVVFLAMAMVVCAALTVVPRYASAFPMPERLEFEISYAGITAGRAVQEVTLEGNEVSIVSTAKSANWLRVFFPVDDRIESVLISGAPPLNIGVPRLYRERIHEGMTRFQKDAVFDRQKLEVNTKDLLKNSETTKSITKRTYDTLSSFFYFRSIPLQVGTSYYIDIFDCKKLWNTEVQILRREVIETPLGRFKHRCYQAAAQFGGDLRPHGRHVYLADGR